jgi:hypothetical protein
MQDSRRPPDFIIGGAMRAGTTSLWSYLGQHPDICMAEIKEPFFFADETDAPVDPTDPLQQTGNFHAGWDWYRRLFTRCDGSALRGEGTARYLHTPSAAALIGHEVPDAKLIFLLRDPAARAYSHYWLQRQGRSLPTFEELVRTSDPIFLRYVDIGRYAHHLSRFFESVDRSRVLVVLFEELRNDPRGVVERALDFVGADASKLRDLDTTPRNPTVAARSGSLERLMHRMEALDARYRMPEVAKRWGRAIRRRFRRANLVPVSAPALDPALRQRIIDLLIDDVTRLEELLGWDLSAWKT